MLDLYDPADAMPLAAFARLELEGWKRLWEAADRESFLAAIGPTTRGMFVAGHYPIDRRLLQLLPKLEIVGSFGVGYDHIDAAAAAKVGIFVRE